MATSNKSHFILNKESEPVAVSPAVWAEWFETADRTVALTEIEGVGRVSTVFVGLNFNYTGGDGPPLLYETMSFLDKARWGFELGSRYATKAAALYGHKHIVEKVIARCTPPDLCLLRVEL